MNAASMPGTAELVPPQRFGSVEEAQRYLKSQDVQYVLAQFVDIHGAAKAKAVPVEHLGHRAERRRGLRRLRASGASAWARTAPTTWPWAIWPR